MVFLTSKWPWNDFWPILCCIFLNVKFYKPLQPTVKNKGFYLKKSTWPWYYLEGCVQGQIQCHDWTDCSQGKIASPYGSINFQILRRTHTFGLPCIKVEKFLKWVFWHWKYRTIYWKINAYFQFSVEAACLFLRLKLLNEYSLLFSNF